jgi:hypothetical protein
MHRHAAIAGLVALTLLSLCAGCGRTTATRNAAETRPEKAATTARRKTTATRTPAAKPGTSQARQALTAVLSVTTMSVETSRLCQWPASRDVSSAEILGSC